MTRRKKKKEKNRETSKILLATVVGFFCILITYGMLLLPLQFTYGISIKMVLIAVTFGAVYLLALIITQIIKSILGIKEEDECNYCS